MTKRTIGVLSVIVLAACNGGDAPKDADRSILVPGPGPYGYDVAKDGRLAFSNFIDGKAAVFVADADGKNAKRVSFGVWDAGPIWSPDGKSVLLTRDAGGHSDVIIVGADSGAERVVAATTSSEVANGWLADGSGVILGIQTGRGNETWIYRVTDSSRVKLFEVDGSADAYASPDGKWFAYTLTKGGHRTVWLWDTDKKTSRQLTTDGFEIVAVGCFSPDSRSIVFESRRTGTSDLWRADVATGAKTQLTQDVGDDFNARWAPDASKVVFTSNRGGQPDVWILTNGDADAVRVTDDALNELAPQWTHAGDGIIAIVPLGHGHLYRLPADGGPAVVLTSGDWGVLDATVSRDGSRIAYDGTRNGDVDLWMVGSAGGAPQLISGGPGFDGDATWSPDGSEIAFASTRSASSDIWVVSSQGGTPRRLTEWTSHEDSPRWSPDGKTIAFRSNRESSGADVWTVPAGRGAPKRLTKSQAANTDIRWSPDSRSLTFTALAGTGTAIFTISAMGGALSEVFSATAFRPDWSPDGRAIAAFSCDAGYCRLQVRKLDGSVVRTFHPDSNVYEFAGRWSRDGAQFLVGYQDLKDDGGNRIELRPAAGGPGKLLSRPPGYSINPVNFASGDSAVIAIGGPNGTALQRIPLPPAPRR